MNRSAISGEQRLRNISTKIRLTAAREMRAFIAGEIPSTGNWNAKERVLIARELDRVFALGLAAGRAALGLPAREGEGDA